MHFIGFYFLWGNDMKIIIAGTRNGCSYETFDRIVRSELSNLDEVTEIVSGGARGIDSLAEEYARVNDIPCKRFPANWKAHGSKAGPTRNIEMGNYADALIALPDKASKGTRHMIKYMKDLDKLVKVYEL